MKLVLSPADVAHKWANEMQDEGRTSGNNFYFRKDTIYSYGSHFPIAIHYKGIAIFTLQTYSNTTAKHIAFTRSAVSYKDKLFCQYVEDAKSGQHQRNINHWRGARYIRQRQNYEHHYTNTGYLSCIFIPN